MNGILFNFMIELMKKKRRLIKIYPVKMTKRSKQTTTILHDKCPNFEPQSTTSEPKLETWYTETLGLIWEQQMNRPLYAYSLMRFIVMIDHFVIFIAQKHFSQKQSYEPQYTYVKMHLESRIFGITSQKKLTNECEFLSLEGFPLSVCY